MAVRTLAPCPSPPHSEEPLVAGQGPGAPLILHGGLPAGPPALPACPSDLPCCRHQPPGVGGSLWLSWGAACRAAPGAQSGLPPSLPGRVSFFTSGSENLHRVEKVHWGTRYAVTIAFTCNPHHAIADPAPT